MAVWSKVGEIISSVAPVLGAAVGGPVGAIAGAAGSLIAGWLGVEDNPEVVSKVLSTNPEALLKLRELESNERVKLMEWQSEQYKATLLDVQSARQREVELAKAGSKAAWSTVILTSLITTGFLTVTGGVIGMEFLGDGPIRFSEAAMLFAGALVNNFGMVTAYHFGAGKQAAQQFAAQPINPAMKQ